MVVASLLASAHFSTVDVKSTTQENPVYAVETVVLAENIATKPVISNITVEDVVKDYFKDIPILAKVAKCESRYRQTDANGEILRGETNKFDVGVMQINEKYHLERAKGMDLNIYTLGGNLEYARNLYDVSGTAPWSASKACWGV